MAIGISTGTQASTARAMEATSAAGTGRRRGPLRRYARWGAGLAGIGVLTALSGLFQQGYRTDFPPPTGTETYAQVLPASIGGEPMAIRPLQLGERYRGARAEYGGAAAIEIVQVANQADLDRYVRSRVRPRLDVYGQRASGKVDGIWALSGRGDAGRLYGWQNQQWLFVIEARSDALFEEAVDRFAYISRR
jgi:hypothetical protein